MGTGGDVGAGCACLGGLDPATDGGGPEGGLGPAPASDGMPAALAAAPPPLPLSRCAGGGRAGGGGRGEAFRGGEGSGCVAVGLVDQDVSVGVGCAHISPFFWSGKVSEVEAALASALPEPIDNPMGSAAYRRCMVTVLARRLIRHLHEGDAS